MENRRPRRSSAGKGVVWRVLSFLRKLHRGALGGGRRRAICFGRLCRRGCDVVSYIMCLGTKSREYDLK